MKLRTIKRDKRNRFKIKKIKGTLYIFELINNRYIRVCKA